MTVEGLTSNGEKMKVKMSSGALSYPIPEFRNSIGQEKLRTVFVFALAHLEGPPLALFCFNGNYNGKTAKNLFSAIKSSRSVLQPSSYHC